MSEFDINSLNDDQKKKLITHLKSQIEIYNKNPSKNQYVISELADMHTTLAYLFSEFSESNEAAISEFNKALNQYHEAGKTEKDPVIYGAIASIYFNLKDFLNSSKFYQKSLEYYNERSNELFLKEIMIGKKGLGLSLINLGEVEKGINLLLESADMCAKIPDPNIFMEIITILKNYYLQQKEWDIIIEIEVKALEILKLTDNFSEIANTNYEIGLCYNMLKNHRKAIEFYKLGVNNAIQSGDNNLIYQGLISIGESYFHLRNIDEAKKEYSKALSLISYLGDENEVNKTKMVLLALGTTEEEINKAISTGVKEKIKK